MNDELIIQKEFSNGGDIKGGSNVIESIVNKNTGVECNADNKNGNASGGKEKQSQSTIEAKGIKLKLSNSFSALQEEDCMEEDEYLEAISTEQRRDVDTYVVSKIIPHKNVMRKWTRGQLQYYYTENYRIRNHDDNGDDFVEVEDVFSEEDETAQFMKLHPSSKAVLEQINGNEDIIPPSQYSNV